MADEPRHEWEVPAFRVQLDGIPEDVKVDVLVGIKPATTAEFEAVLEAGGGPRLWTLGYNGEYLRNGTLGSGPSFHLHPPADAEKLPPKPAVHPFLAKHAAKLVEEAP